jgi:hypothetical protein
MRKFIFLPFLFSFFNAFAQNEIKIYPSNWWVGMKNPHLQVLIRGKNAGKGKLIFSPADNPGIKLESIQKVKNPNYLFLNFTIGPNAKPGKLTFDLHILDTYIVMGIPLEKLISGNGKTYARGINSSDFIYLLMPDRFSNGDPNNDHYANMRDTVADRRNPLARHGGDLQGVINHLDYIQQLGATAIWLTPVIENDMPLEKEPSGMLSGYRISWLLVHRPL